MVIRRHWAAVGILAGVFVAGCDGSSEKVSAPPGFKPPTEAEVERGKKMLGPGMDVLKDMSKKNAPGKR
jgi:hypothetical protein